LIKIKGKIMERTLQNKLESGFNNFTTTENGAISRKTTESAVLDLFSQINAYRTGKVINQRIPQLEASWNEDKLLTLKVLFYSRDIRGGMGEREVFRTFIRHLATRYPAQLKASVAQIPNYGRWDDLYALVGTPLESDAFDVIKAQWLKDLDTDKPSIMGKWLKSINTSSKESVALGIKTAKALGVSAKVYRKVLSKLRSNINVLEKLISSNKWESVEYSHVPSQANLKYGKAFMKHDAERRSAFFDALTRGDADVKINATTQFPYEIIQKLREYKSDFKTEEAMWKAQPDYFNGVEENSLVVADVSGSMSGLPLDVCLSLALYTAERNKGVWKDKFITFSNEPTMQSLVGNTIKERMENLSRAKWDMNTNISKVFERILEVAVREKVQPSEMVARLYIVSDMEFDSACSADKTLFNKIRDKFSSYGYTLPNLVFWNVAARNVQFPMSMDDRGFINVSGCSPSIFKSVVGKKFVGPYEMMLEVLNSPRYEAIVVQ
jgi:hypothetical protein